MHTLLPYKKTVGDSSESESDLIKHDKGIFPCRKCCSHVNCKCASQAEGGCRYAERVDKGNIFVGSTL
jgi:hypothetical protein